MSERSAGAPFVVRIVGGIVLVALVVGIALWAERATDDELALPDEVAGLDAAPTALAREVADPHREGISEVYDAEVVSALYGSEPDRRRLLVTAVRARSGPLAPALFTDGQDWVEDGDVTCLVTPQRKQRESVVCQRGDGDLTVQLFNLGSKGLGVDEVVDATNEVWEDLS